jgi:hypothetical protein
VSLHPETRPEATEKRRSGGPSSPSIERFVVNVVEAPAMQGTRRSARRISSVHQSLEDRFDDLSTIDVDGHRERTQFKHSEDAGRPLTVKAADHGRLRRVICSAP